MRAPRAFRNRTELNSFYTIEIILYTPTYDSSAVFIELSNSKTASHSRRWLYNIIRRNAMRMTGAREINWQYLRKLVSLRDFDVNRNLNKRFVLCWRSKNLKIVTIALALFASRDISINRAFLWFSCFSFGLTDPIKYVLTRNNKQLDGKRYKNYTRKKVPTYGSSRPSFCAAHLNALLCFVENPK